MEDPATAVRARLHEDGQYATSLWAQADKDLAKAMRALKARDSDMDMRKTPPLRWDSVRTDRGETGESPTDITRGYKTGSSQNAESSHARAARIATARSSALQNRATQMHCRAGEAAHQIATNAKRRLRVKIVDILREVAVRKSLHQQQEKARVFREARYSQGRGPRPSMGDADNYAIGLSGIRKEEHIPGEPAVASPRRIAILDSLTMEELDSLRGNTWFYLTGPAAETAVKDPGGSGSTMSGSNAGTANTEVAMDALIEFFAPHREEKDAPIEEYARKLRARVNPANFPSSNPPQVDPTHAMAPSIGPSDNLDPLERMPCQSRRPPIREDQASPTLAKVREVYNRRDEADAKWIEDRRQTMARREALNTFKAEEQLRERQLEVMKQTELHKVRMLEAEERKTLLDLELAERNEIMEAVKMHKVKIANDKAEEKLDEKRGKASTALEVWREGVDRSELTLRRQERELTRLAEGNWEKYMEKLWKMGNDRHNRMESQNHKNVDLKVRIQSSLKVQLQDTLRKDSQALAEVLDAKQLAAAERREKGLGARYGFVEKAFGPQAAGFDAKHHWAATDRRSLSWQRNFSEPTLTLTR